MIEREIYIEETNIMMTEIKDKLLSKVKNEIFEQNYSYNKPWLSRPKRSPRSFSKQENKLEPIVEEKPKITNEQIEE